MRLDPNYALAYTYLGSAYYFKGDYDRAIENHTQAIRLNPNLTLAYYRRGVNYKMKRDYNRAIADLETALWLDPDDAYAKQELDSIQQHLR